MSSYCKQCGDPNYENVCPDCLEKAMGLPVNSKVKVDPQNE